jgi:hypothetical protein
MCRQGPGQRTVDADECDALSEGLHFLGVLSTGGPRRLTFYYIGGIEFLPVPVWPDEQGATAGAITTKSKSVL